MRRIEALEWLEKSLHRTIRVCNDHEASLCLIKELYSAGALKVEVEDTGNLNDPEDLTRSAIYVTLKFPINKPLFKILMELEPDEFNEVEENIFRLWWD